ncbi:MAG: hypothetical protein MZW92_77695 [Comamonadaceae bacterium]|nr:hypothetical protein [Comamonadaceae bacterium]
MADGDLTRAGHGDRGHHRRHRRLGELHGGGAARAWWSQVQSTAEQRDRRHDRRSRRHRHRAAGRLRPSSLREIQRHRRIGAADGRPRSTTCRAGAANRPRWRASRWRPPRRGLRAVQNTDRRHERDPRPDPGDLQADQAAGRVARRRSARSPS